MSCKLRIEDKIISTQTSENLLEALQNAGIAIDSGCKSGNCHRCIIQCKKGTIPSKAQAGLKNTLSAQGYLLACQCQIQSDMLLTLDAINIEKLTVTIQSIEKKTPIFMVLKVSLPEGFHFEAGQSLIIWKTEKDGRTYSIASTPSQNQLELHIKKYKNGCLTSWLFDEVQIGDAITIQGPSGSCFYTKTDQPILLVGNGTGLSPLVGILRSALEQSHRSPIHLIHYVREMSQSYFQAELNSLSKLYKNFSFEVIAENDPTHKKVINTAITIIKQNPIHTIYLAGSDGLVNTLRKQLFIYGASLNNIHSDIFSPQS